MNRQLIPMKNGSRSKIQLKNKKSKIAFLLYIGLPVLVIASVVVYIVVFSGKGVGAQAGAPDNSSRILAEIGNEQAVLEQEKKRLEDYERNLKAFEMELDRKNNDYLQKERDLLAKNEALKAKEEAFNKKVADKMVDRQMIETYESIDPEQAAILIKNLYEKDSELAVLVIRKIAGKKAGKILEAMIPLDKEVSTKLAKEAMDYYKIK